MEKYNDFAINPNIFDVMAKEYQVHTQSKAQSVKVKDFDKKDISELFAKLEYLQTLIKALMANTQNADILLVLDDIQSSLQSQNNLLSELFDSNISTQGMQDEQFKMFCNNLKIAINTTSDIVKILIKIKDSEATDFDKKEKLTNIINSFLDINNNLVSLFGECRYLRY